MVTKRSQKSAIVRVHDVAQEYWYIDKSPCACGGHFGLSKQQLTFFKGKPIDVMEVACGLCGKARQLRFDISSFHGAEVTQHTTAITQLAEEVNDENLKRRLMSAIEDPVVNAMQTILDLADSGDTPALDWLLDAILDPEGMGLQRGR